ncbi:MAG: NAD(P)H-hydrate dehydratase [Rickettsiales bacterium]|nr:NAD(P)H-hydrate dehydratase [Rickettsiales bacterium]
MKKIFSAENTKKADSEAERFGISNFTLMCNAGEKSADLVDKILDYKKKGDAVYILCGVGNNGGDGYITARILKERGYDIRLSNIGDLRKVSELTLQAMDFAVSSGIEIEEFDEDYLEQADLIIDAIFGIGLKRDITGDIAEIIEKINYAKNSQKNKFLVFSLDVPSGVCSNTGEVRNIAIQADYTISYQTPKIGCYLLPAKNYVGKIEVADIGIPDEAFSEIYNPYFINSTDLWLDKFPFPKLESHKYHKGHIVIDGGEEDFTGASRMASIASMRVGAGLATICADEKSLPIYATSMLSVMVKRLKEIEDLEKYIKLKKVNSAVLGCGSGFDILAPLRVYHCLEEKLACVIDADVFSIFQEKPKEFIKALKKNKKSVLTPHEGEFKRVFNVDGSKIERASKAAKLCDNVIVLKGNDTIIASPDGRIAVNNNAPTWLATAGSGDVLAGIIGGLLAQNMPSFEAACAGVWIHSECANILGQGLISEDLIDAIPLVLQSLSQDEKLK